MDTDSQAAVALHADLLRGGVGATEQLYALVVHLVRNFTRKALSWGADPDDIVHDIYVAVHRAIHGGSVRHPDRLRGYIVATAQKQISESLRRHLRHPAQSLEDTDPLREHTPDPEKLLFMLEMRRRLEVLLATLPKIDQIIIQQFYYGEKPWQTIAADLNLSPTQFRLRKCRALARIRGLAGEGAKPQCH
ncbi:MAG: sigma-70 family RNA polymerase sigma factor [Bryobacteraceae bacterium]